MKLPVTLLMMTLLATGCANFPAGTGGEHEFGKIRRKRHDARGVRDIRRGLPSVRFVTGEKRRQRYDEKG